MDPLFELIGADWTIVKLEVRARMTRSRVKKEEKNLEAEELVEEDMLVVGINEIVVWLF